MRDQQLADDLRRQRQSDERRPRSRAQSEQRLSRDEADDPEPSRADAGGPRGERQRVHAGASFLHVQQVEAVARRAGERERVAETRAADASTTSAPTMLTMPASASTNPAQKRAVGRSPRIAHAPSATKIGALTPISVAFAALVCITAELKNARSAPNRMPAMIAARTAAGVERVDAEARRDATARTPPPRTRAGRTPRPVPERRTNVRGSPTTRCRTRRSRAKQRRVVARAIAHWAPQPMALMSRLAERTLTWPQANASLRQDRRS